MRAVLLRRLLTASVLGGGILFPTQATQAGNVPPAVAIVHRERASGWGVTETANFLIYHHHPEDFVDKAAGIAEKARATALRKWFGETDNWTARCVIYLYSDVHEYQELSGAPAASPAHTQVRVEEGRVLSRSIHLRGHHPDLLRAILPHEVTHAVLAGHFGDFVPRWADEGMAVLNEPRDRIDAHLHDLPKWRNQRRLIALQDLIEMHDYPPPWQIGAFYAESVSLVEFLTRQKDAQTLARFVREGQRRGYDVALKRCYGWDFEELEKRWRQYAFAPAAGE
jgi:hypothetical protein